MTKLLIPEALDHPCRNAEVDGWHLSEAEDLPDVIPALRILYVRCMQEQRTPRGRAHVHGRFTVASAWADWLREHEPSCWREEKERS